MAGKIFRRRRNVDEDEVVSARASIRNHCIECMGYCVQEVDRCTAPKCWLYPWRMGPPPGRFKGKGKGNLAALALSGHWGRTSVPPRGGQEPSLG